MKVRSLAARGFMGAKELAFPRTCAVCDRRGSWLCEECAPDWSPMNPALCCDRCGHPLTGGHCQACREMHPLIARARSVAAYDGWPRIALQRFKYDRERDRSELLAERMIGPLMDLGDVDALVPIPLHHTKQQDRGFNQSEVIAHHLSRNTGIPVESALMRVKQTASQTRLNREQRMENLKGAMELVPGWIADPARHYVLVDDVYTTGTTAGTCAEQLERAGVEHLSVLTFMVDLRPAELERYRRLLIAAGN